MGSEMVQIDNPADTIDISDRAIWWADRTGSVLWNRSGEYRIIPIEIIANVVVTYGHWTQMVAAGRSDGNDCPAYCKTIYWSQCRPYMRMAK